VESIFAIKILIFFTMVLGVLDRDQLRAFFVQSFLPSRYQTNALSVAIYDARYATQQNAVIKVYSNIIICLWSHHIINTSCTVQAF